VQPKLDFDSINEVFLSDLRNKKIAKGGTFWREDINPDELFNSVDGNSSDSIFWSQHGENVIRYKELILNYNEAKRQIEEHGNLDHLSSNHPVNMAYQVLHGSEPIRLIEYNGKLLVSENGRHRIEAAKLLKKEGIDVKISAEITRFLTTSRTIQNNQSQVNSTLSNMANYQIENQIELLRNAKSLFSEHAEKVQELTELFNARVRMLEQDELNHDYMDFIEEFLRDYVVKLKSIRETIEDEYLPQLERKIRHLEERE